MSEQKYICLIFSLWKYVLFTTMKNMYIMQMFVHNKVSGTDKLQDDANTKNLNSVHIEDGWDSRGTHNTEVNDKSVGINWQK